MPDRTKVWSRNESMLARLGFAQMEDRGGVMVIAHPENPKVKLIASSLVEGRLDLFTQFGSSPLNTPGDPLNICMGINDHDPVLVETMVATATEYFTNLEV